MVDDTRTSSKASSACKMIQRNECRLESEKKEPVVDVKRTLLSWTPWMIAIISPIKISLRATNVRWSRQKFNRSGDIVQLSLDSPEDEKDARCRWVEVIWTTISILTCMARTSVTENSKSDRTHSGCWHHDRVRRSAGYKRIILCRVVSIDLERYQKHSDIPIVPLILLSEAGWFQPRVASHGFYQCLSLASWSSGRTVSECADASPGPKRPLLRF